MGREVMRVALDFDWPLNKIWKGYVNPYNAKCPNNNCESGYTGARRWLQSMTHLLMMLGGEAIRPDKELHPWLRDLPLRPGIPIDGQAAELTGGLAGRQCDRFFGHDACDNWSAERKIIKAAGLNPKVWGICPTCKGEAMDPKQKRKRNAWRPTKPPQGEGWQMWETTSEGSPISPVKESPEALARWLADNGASSLGHETATYEQWLKMILAGWAPTAMTVPGKGLVSGVEAVSRI